MGEDKNVLIERQESLNTKTKCQSATKSVCALLMQISMYLDELNIKHRENRGSQPSSLQFQANVLHSLSKIVAMTTEVLNHSTSKYLTVGVLHLLLSYVDINLDVAMVTLPFLNPDWLHPSTLFSGPSLPNHLVPSSLGLFCSSSLQ